MSIVWYKQPNGARQNSFFTEKVCSCVNAARDIWDMEIPAKMWNQWPRSKRFFRHFRPTHFLFSRKKRWQTSIINLFSEQGYKTFSYLRRWFVVLYRFKAKWRPKQIRNPRLLGRSRFKPWLWPCYFLLWSSDCMMENCMPLAIGIGYWVGVHEQWWPQKRL